MPYRDCMSVTVDRSVLSMPGVGRVRLDDTYVVNTGFHEPLASVSATRWHFGIGASLARFYFHGRGLCAWRSQRHELMVIGRGPGKWCRADAASSPQSPRCPDGAGAPRRATPSARASFRSSATSLASPTAVSHASHKLLDNRYEHQNPH